MTYLTQQLLKTIHAKIKDNNNKYYKTPNTGVFLCRIPLPYSLCFTSTKQPLIKSANFVKGESPYIYIVYKNQKKKNTNFNS